jgi:hypothetical protein
MPSFLPHSTLIYTAHSRDSVGHKGQFGHEFLEFEFRPDGTCRYANNSNYKKDTMIKKECMRRVNPLRSLTCSARIARPDAGAQARRQDVCRHGAGRPKVAHARQDGSPGAGDCAGQGAHFLHGAPWLLIISSPLRT